MKTTTLPLRNLMNRPPLRAFLFIPFVLACFALSPQARAVCQEGCDLSNGNTFLGDDALILNTTGVDNTAIGSQALLSNTIGSQNTATGHLGTITSSKRFKDAIKPMGDASETILALKPVTFRYKQELDPNAIPQFGLVAEQVEKVNPDLVARDDEGKPYSVRYEAMNAMLLNEFLKEHRKAEEQDHKIQRQEATIAQLKSALAKQETVDAEQQKQIKALTAGLQRVSAQVEMSRPSPRTVVDNH
jgi:uncharacterized coiled-coil protein SlyX